MSHERIIVTGGAGFIGSNLIDKLLADNFQVTCLDDFNDYYDPALKRKNIKAHLEYPNYRLIQGDIRDKELVADAVKEWEPAAIVHLAARAGVRPSISESDLYYSTNVLGTRNVLEVAKECRIPRIVFGSSSSVYGLNEKVPFTETDALLKPASPYAATKIAGEALCHTYSHLFGINIISLRFFTVYGPRQRPDLAIRKFAEKILRGEEITLYGNGTSARDYTYVDDIVQGIVAALDYQGERYENFNLGNSSPIQLSELVSLLEKALDKKAKIKWTDDQAGDVPITFADISQARLKLGYIPSTPISVGLMRFAHWLGEYRD